LCITPNTVASDVRKFETGASTFTCAHIINNYNFIVALACSTTLPFSARPPALRRHPSPEGPSARHHHLPSPCSCILVILLCAVERALTSAWSAPRAAASPGLRRARQSTPRRAAWLAALWWRSPPSKSWAATRRHAGACGAAAFSGGGGGGGLRHPFLSIIARPTTI